MSEAKLDLALASYREWDCQSQSGKPFVERAIQEGLSNDSYLLRWGGQRFILRLFSERSLHFAGVEAEITISQQAHCAGLAPRQVYSSLQHLFVISEYVEGVHWTLQQAGDSNNILRLARSLKQIHRLSGGDRELILPAVIKKYQQRLIGTGFENAAQGNWQQQVLDLAIELRESLEEPLLCHNDLVLDNILDNGNQLYIIDWEYAALCDPMYEIAVIGLNHQYSADQIQLLLLAYYGEIENAHRNRFERMYLVATYIDYLWYATQSLVIDNSNLAQLAESKLESLQLLLGNAGLLGRTVTD